MKYFISNNKATHIVDETEFNMYKNIGFFIISEVAEKGGVECDTTTKTSKHDKGKPNSTHKTN